MATPTSTTPTLDGKPYAGNPHVRFDEGENASAKPRRGSLLYKLLTGTHDIDSPSYHLVTAPICIGDMAWVATGAIVLPGVTVGEGAVVGAGAIVTKDVEPWTVVAGNPAKVIRCRAKMEL